MTDAELQEIFPVENHINIFDIPGKFTSQEITTRLALLHRRKTLVNTQVRALQTELCELPKDSPVRLTKVKQLNTLLQEVTGLNGLITEHNILVKNALDIFFIDEVKAKHPKIYAACVNAALEKYDLKHSI